MLVVTGTSVVGCCEVAVAVAVTGQTVVLMAIVSVVTDPTGQLVTVGAHDVIVYVTVFITVLVVYAVVEAEDEDAPVTLLEGAAVAE